MAENVFINHGEEFENLIVEREILNNTYRSNPNISLDFMVESTYQLSPGLYTARVKIDSPEFPDPNYVTLNINVNEYLAIELSESEVQVLSDGPPGDYDGDREIILSVASNVESWEARALGENLTSTDDEIPAERLFIFSSDKSDDGYMPLNIEQIVASGTYTELSEASNLSIRVRTTWEDKAGEYSGRVYFTVIALP